MTEPKSGPGPDGTPPIPKSKATQDSEPTGPQPDGTPPIPASKSTDMPEPKTGPAPDGTPPIPPSKSPQDLQPTPDPEADESNRQRIASIASRFGGLASQASSQAATTAAKTTSTAVEAAQSVAETINTTRHAAATQTAGLLQAMALTTKHALSPADKEKEGKHWYEYESPLHARRRIAEMAEYESPLHARRRLAAIASQLGLATSNAKQAPSLLGALTSSPQTSSSHTTKGDKKWDTVSLPTYRELPSEGGWPGCAWSVWGKGDQLGTINLLTESLVLRSAKEQIKLGRTVSLNWPVHLPAEPFFRRKALTHKPYGKGGPGYTDKRDEYVAHVRKSRPDVVVKEDEKVPISDELLELNTQSGSQWDGFRHFGHMPLNVFYGGASRASVHDSFSDERPQPASPEEWNSDEAIKRNALGIHHLAQHGICGRGVLLDVFEYLSHHGTEHVKRENYPWSHWPAYGGGKAYDPRTGFRITVADLIATAKHQNVTFRRGDILLIRSGFTARYYSFSRKERAEWSDPAPKHGGEGMEFAGVEQGEEMKEFIWNNHFAAVAGDSPGEYPLPPDSLSLIDLEDH